MRKKGHDIRQTIETPLLGFGAVLLFLAAMLVLLWTITVVVRVVLG